MGNYSNFDKNDISLEEQIKEIAENPDNFIDNALSVKMTSEKEELINIIEYVSEILFADKDFSDQEYTLLTKLMEIWEISKNDLKS